MRGRSVSTCPDGDQDQHLGEHHGAGLTTWQRTVSNDPERLLKVGERTSAPSASSSGSSFRKADQKVHQDREKTVKSPDHVCSFPPTLFKTNRFWKTSLVLENLENSSVFLTVAPGNASGCVSGRVSGLAPLQHCCSDIDADFINLLADFPVAPWWLVPIFGKPTH